MPGWSYASVWTGIAETVPDRDAIVCGSATGGLGRLRRPGPAPRDATSSMPGVRPGDKVAIDATNRPEYLETMFAAWLVGASPVNVNYRYVADEVRYVLDNSDARALVHDPAFADRGPRGDRRNAAARRPVVVLETGAPYEAAVAAASPDGAWSERAPTATTCSSSTPAAPPACPRASCGATTTCTGRCGRWRARARSLPTRSPRPRAGKRTGTALPACPLMHGTGLFIALSTLAGGGHGRPRRRHRVSTRSCSGPRSSATTVAVLTIVGDVFARPLLDALDAEPRPLVGPHDAAGDHLVGRHVEPGGEGRACSAISRR